MRLRRLTLVALSLALVPVAAVPAQAAPSTAYAAVVPAPVRAMPASGSFTIRAGTVISTDSAPVGEYLAGFLRRSTRYPLPVRPAKGAPAGIALLLSGAPASVGDEGYQLDVTRSAVVIRARRAAGLFAGV